MEKEEEDDEEVPPAEARRACLFGRHGQLLAKAPLAYAQLTRRLRGPYADVRKQLHKTPTEDNQCSFKKRHSNA